MFLARILNWPESSAAYHKYINSEKRAVTATSSTFFPCYPFTARTNRLHTVEIIPPPVEIVQNKQLPESHKRLNLHRMYDDVTIYKIEENYIKKINRKNTFEYIVNNKYRVTLTDNSFVDELISLLFI